MMRDNEMNDMLAQTLAGRKRSGSGAWEPEHHDERCSQRLHTKDVGKIVILKPTDYTQVETPSSFN